MRLVHGVVTRHEAFGFYVDIGKEQDAVVNLPMISDDPNEVSPVYPEIGAGIEAVLLGFTAIGNQARLSTRHSDLLKAKDRAHEVQDCRTLSAVRSPRWEGGWPVTVRTRVVASRSVMTEGRPFAPGSNERRAEARKFVA